MVQKERLQLLTFLLVLVMITSSFASGTLARYITSANSEDSARVAIWGVNADATTMDLFDSEYDANGRTIVRSHNGDNLIAPGTSKSSQFSIITFGDLAPEVMYEITINIDDTEIDPLILNNPSIQWKLDNNTWGTWEECKEDILALSGDASGSKIYETNKIADEFANGKNHVIAWQWIMDNANDEMDTEMGNAAAERDITAKISVEITAVQYNGSASTPSTPGTPTNLIPSGGTYYIGVTNTRVGDYSDATDVLNAGDEFPENVGTGDIYVYGGYEYRYNYRGVTNMDSDALDHPIIWERNTSQNGWGVRLIDFATVTNTSSVLSNINGKNITNLDYTFSTAIRMTSSPSLPQTVTSMQGTFENCFGLVNAPAIPSNVTDLYATFSGCSSLTTAPTIPNNVTNLHKTFAGTAITTAPVIPASVENMYTTFLSCSNLTGTIEINTDTTNYNGMLNGTQITEVTGSTPYKTEILATK